MDACNADDENSVFMVTETVSKGMTLEDGTEMNEIKTLDIYEVDDSVHKMRSHLRNLGEREHFRYLGCTCQVPEGIVVDESIVDHNMEEEELPQFEEEWRLKWNPNIGQASGGFKSHELAVKPQGSNNQTEISSQVLYDFSPEHNGAVVTCNKKKIRGEDFDDKLYREVVDEDKNGVEQSRKVTTENVADREEFLEEWNSKWNQHVDKARAFLAQGQGLWFMSQGDQ